MSDKTPVSDYDFELPEELIAQHPADRRGGSKLLVVETLRTSNALSDTESHPEQDEEYQSAGDKFSAFQSGVSDRMFYEIPELLDKDSFLVVNTTRVMKARLFAVKPTGGHVEVLVLEKTSENTCTAITKGKVKEGTRLNIGEYQAVIDKILPDGSRTVVFDGVSVSKVMEEYGHMPLPPYITRKDTKADTERYQTVYSKEEGSVAAPTAGLHFTPEILQAVKDRGIPVLEVTLNIGIGTFRPVKADYLEDHDMHTEKYYIDEETAAEVNRLKAAGKKLVAVGTTAVRALESAAEDGQIRAGYGETNLFIRPGYSFRAVDELITNFHLPKSTLFVLVSQLAGRESMLAAYEHAKKSGYRFFSYGDAMYIQAQQPEAY